MKFLENISFEECMELIANVNEITGLKDEISKLEMEPVFYDQCIYFRCDECMIIEEVKEKGCDCSCTLFEDTERGV